MRQEKIYRQLRGSTAHGKYITLGKKMYNLGSNDYLGMDVPLQDRQMQSSSRLISGNDGSFQELETRLAAHKSKQASIVFPTGYMANMGVISALARRGDTIFSDELNHASIIESCRLAGSNVVIYRHNDAADLEAKARSHGGRKFVITEGVFSMDGDMAPLDEITEVAQKHDAITILDDAHGDFAVGRDGRGTPDVFGVAKDIDVYTSSLSKALGSFGGYVAADRDIIDLCTNRSKPFIYTSALPSAIIHNAVKRFDSDRQSRQEKLVQNVSMLASGLGQIGFDAHKSHIIPIISSQHEVMKLAAYLQENGVFAHPVRYPTVRQARIRISVTARFDSQDIQEILSVFGAAYGRFC